jgi:hypothetical protein
VILPRVRRLLIAALLAVGLLAAGDGAARPHTIMLGVLGPHDRFESLTGQRSVVKHEIFAFGQASFHQVFAPEGPAPMIGFGATGIAPLDIARGRGDSFLIALNAYANSVKGLVFVRPMGEMNGHWNPYCAFNRDGSSRGPRYSTAAFKKAFARIYLVAHGGPKAAINAQLRRLGLPPVAQDLPALPKSRLQVVWNPQGYGSPDLPGNSAQSYYPGDRYVDVVGNDLYDIRGKAEWAAAEALYRAHPGKPYAFPEWGLWGIDDPAFVERMAAFARGHSRLVLLAYFNAKPGSIFDLASKPRSLAAYRRLIVPLAS